MERSCPQAATVLATLEAPEVVEALPVEAPLFSAHARCQAYFEGGPAYYDRATFGERRPVFPPWAGPLRWLLVDF